MRNAHGGQSSGPLEIDRPWDSYTDDLLGLMDHLGIQRFMVLGYCVGAPYIWNLVRRAPDRVVAAVPAQPVGWNKAHPTYMREASMKSWAPELMKRNPAITPDMIDAFRLRGHGDIDEMPVGRGEDKQAEADREPDRGFALCCGRGRHVAHGLRDLKSTR